LTLSACTSQPNESTLYYKDYDCDRLAMELNRVDRQIVALHDQLNKKTDDDVVEIMPFWATPFSLEGGDGPVFLEREDEPEVKEYAHLKGEKEAIETVAIHNKCGIAFKQLAEAVPSTSTVAGNKY